MIVSNPTGQTFPDWAAALILDNGIPLSLPAPEPGLWQAWVASLNDQINAALPDPYAGYASWDQWALDSVLYLESFDV